MFKKKEVGKTLNRKRLDDFQILRAPDGRYYTVRPAFPMIEYPESWGTKAHALTFVAAQYGLSASEFQKKKRKGEKA